MNKERRKELSDIFGKLTELKARLEEVQAQEQEYYDNMPDGIKDSERGEQAESYAYSLDDCVSQLDDICDTLEEIICA